MVAAFDGTTAASEGAEQSQQRSCSSLGVLRVHECADGCVDESRSGRSSAAGRHQSDIDLL